MHLIIYHLKGDFIRFGHSWQFKEIMVTWVFIPRYHLSRPSLLKFHISSAYFLFKRLNVLLRSSTDVFRVNVLLQKILLMSGLYKCFHQKVSIFVSRAVIFACSAVSIKFMPYYIQEMCLSGITHHMPGTQHGPKGMTSTGHDHTMRASYILSVELNLSYMC